MIQHNSQRVAVLIDVQNLYYSARNLHNAKVNFGNIVTDAVAGRQLTRAIAYVVRTKTGEEKPFFEALEKLGIETKEKDLQIFFGGAKKADWDVGLAVDAIILSEKVDAIVLVSGDGDYLPLVQYLKMRGVHVEVVAFGETSSAKLIEGADGFVDMSLDKNRYLITGRSGKTETTLIKTRKETDKDSATRKKGRPRIPLSSIE